MIVVVRFVTCPVPAEVTELSAILEMALVVSTLE